MQEQQIQARSEEERLKREYEESRDEKNRQRDLLVAEIRSAGMGSMVDLNKNSENDFKDAMADIRQTEQYQVQTDLQRDKETNRMSIESDKSQIEREKIQSQREIANMQLQIAQENKNKYDNKNNKK